jgi:hypothetical protein
MEEAYNTFKSSSTNNYNGNMIRATIEKLNGESISNAKSIHQTLMNLNFHNSLHSSLLNSSQAQADQPSSSTGLTFKMGVNEHQNAFKIPKPIIKKSKGFGSFFSANELAYTPMQNDNSNKIRFIKEVLV